MTRIWSSSTDDLTEEGALTVLGDHLDALGGREVALALFPGGPTVAVPEGSSVVERIFTFWIIVVNGRAREASQTVNCNTSNTSVHAIRLNTSNTN